MVVGPQTVCLRLFLPYITEVKELFVPLKAVPSPQRRGCSSVGRAVALQAIGQEFKSPQLHQPPVTINMGL